MRRCIFVGAMLASFVFGLLRADARWRSYQESEFRGKGADVSYLDTLPYSVRQMVDLDWIALTPLRILHALPRSLTLDGRTGARSQSVGVAAAMLSAAAFWFLVAVWSDHLKRARSLTVAGRIAGVVALAFVFFALVLLSALWRQTETDPRNERLSDAAIVPALLLVLMSLAMRMAVCTHAKALSLRVDSCFTFLQLPVGG